MLILKISSLLHLLIVMLTILSISSLRLLKSNIKLKYMKAYSNTKLRSVVNNMNVNDFKAILKSSDKSVYQIIDVREKDELQQISIADPDIIHLPLSDAANWTAEVLQGKILDSSKPTVCLCKAGMRSMRAASFLVTQAKFDEVYNVEGGISSFLAIADKSDVIIN